MPNFIFLSVIFKVLPSTISNLSTPRDVYVATFDIFTLFIKVIQRMVEGSPSLQNRRIVKAGSPSQTMKINPRQSFCEPFHPSTIISLFPARLLQLAPQSGSRRADYGQRLNLILLLVKLPVFREHHNLRS